MSTRLDRGPERDTRVARAAVSESRGTREFPWKYALFVVTGLSIVASVAAISRLSPLLTPRSSIAALRGGGYRTKLRGIAIPISDALSITNTDIRAIAYRRTTRKYRHNGWQLIEDESDQVCCSIDDGTGCIDIDLTLANVQYNNTVTIYNDIAGEPANQTPYIDDVCIHVRYIPVGAIVTIIGMLGETETGYRASKFVRVYAGDERSEVRRLKVFVCTSICMLLISSLMFQVLGKSR
ncbi:MAG: hypothetical protein ACKO14_04120 [Armatimonadota bacterium]